MATFKKAGPVVILRSAQKDEDFLNQLKTYVSEIVQGIAGTRTWLNIHKNAEAICELVYFSLTTLSLRQTLGEEYTGVLQVDASHRKLPTFIARCSMVVLYSLGPLLISKALSKLEESIKCGYLSIYFKPQLHNLLVRNIITLKYIVTLIHRIHLATFFLRGTFYHIPKRLTGIHYVLVRDWLGDNTANKPFQRLGIVLFLQIGLTSLQSLYRFYKSLHQPENTPTGATCYIPTHLQCSLCLDQRHNSSVTPCGHLFCWSCIHECLQTTSQCPICRHAVLPSQIVPLINYD